MSKRIITPLVMIPLAVAVSAATAANVTVYGKLDLGLTFTSVDTGAPGADRANQLQMQTGQTAGSRVGIKGWEDLGGGYRAGFVLEAGYTPDTGASAQGGRLFGRQADARLSGPFGTIKFGRMGALASGFPDTSLFGGNMSPFAVGFGEVPGHLSIFTGDWGCLDNAITYSTPSFAGGWQVIAQYSFDRNTLDSRYYGSHGTEGTSGTDKFMALALHFQNATTEFNVVLDSTNYATADSAQVESYGDDNSKVLTVGIRHKTSFATLYADGQIFRDARDFVKAEWQGTKWLTNYKPKDGWGATIGAEIPAGGGHIKVAVGYMDVEDSNASLYESGKKSSLKRYIAGIGYWHDLSKRTAIYTDIGYVRDDASGDTWKGYDAATLWAANLGIVHNF